MSLLYRDLSQAAKTYADQNTAAAVTVYEAGSESELELPAVVVNVPDLEEMEAPMYGHFRATLLFEVMTHPQDTTLDEFETLVSGLQDALGNLNVLGAALCDAVGTVHHLRALPGVPETDGDLRTCSMGAVVSFSTLATPGSGYTSPAIINDAYLPLAGGTMTGKINLGDYDTNTTGNLWAYKTSGDSTPSCKFTYQGLSWLGATESDGVSFIATSPDLALTADGTFTNFSIGCNVTLGAGKTVQYSDDVDWTAVTHNTGWVDVGSPYQTGRYCKRQGVVYVEGYSNRSSGSATKIFTLPAGCRPAAQLAFKTNNNLASDYLAQVSVEANGDVSTQTGEVHVGITFNFYAG